MTNILISENNINDPEFISLFTIHLFDHIKQRLYEQVCEKGSRFRTHILSREYGRIGICFEVKNGIIRWHTVSEYLTMLSEIKITHLELLQALWCKAFQCIEINIDKNPFAKLACIYIDWMKKNGIMTYPITPDDLRDYDFSIIFEHFPEAKQSCLDENKLHLDVIKAFIITYFIKKNQSHLNPFIYKSFHENLFFYNNFLERKYIEEEPLELFRVEKRRF